MSEFIKVAQLSDIPEDTGFKVEAEGREVALFKVNGEVKAIYNICPHSGAPLCEGGVRENVVTCPWHGWDFDLTSGECVFNDSIKQPVFEVKVEGEDVFVKA